MNASSLRQQQNYARDPSGFLDQAIFLARASELAYSDDAAWISHSLGLCRVSVFPEHTVLPLPNTQGFWFRHEGVAVIVFRGSANRQHWLSNFKVLPPSQQNHPWGTVHPGFSASLQAVVDTVLRPFAEAAKGAEMVWLSGHSLGGALAVLASAWLYIEQGLRPALITFGQPMPGFDTFRAQFDTELNGSLTRVINRSDLVPRLPGLRYAHCGVSKTITRGSELEALGVSDSELQLTDEDAIPADPTTLERFLADLESLPDDDFAVTQPQGIVASRLPWIAHHSISEYALQLRRLRSEQV